MTAEPSKFWRPLRYALRPFNRPHHYALAIAIGMVIGVVPKFSIVPWLVVLSGLILPTNLIALVVSAIAFSFIGPLFDTQSHWLGATLLGHQSLETFWKNLFSFQYSIWLQLHNSVVLGSTLIAIAAIIPTYVISRSATSILKPVFKKYLLSNSVADWIRGYPLQTG